ncbi:DUF2637 domain-containing protein [Streptomyces pratisoli]|uniref:DUF2637 domain-containing protein n=1 Tax=Streptomyces pratisoli TaxID=3139917 RepID=UPI003C12C08E
MAAMQLTRTHRILIGVVVAGAVIIAAIGFAGSYAAVRELAEQKGFGDFSLVFPIGIDAGICVLLALDLLLTWIRIPFPLLRQTAWLLTAATIAFNGAAAWPDPLGVGMHAVIPVLFVVSVEAARHAVGRIADITADKHMEGVRLTRWLLSPIPTFRLWRRMKLWELRSYEQVIKLEQDRLIYQARLQARYGRAWRRKAPVEALMPLRLARYGVPLAETAPAGLAAAGIEPVLLPPDPQVDVIADSRAVRATPVPQKAAPAGEQRPQLESPSPSNRTTPSSSPPSTKAPGSTPGTLKRSRTRAATTPRTNPRSSSTGSGTRSRARSSTRPSSTSRWSSTPPSSTRLSSTSSSTRSPSPGTGSPPRRRPAASPSPPAPAAPGKWARAAAPPNPPPRTRSRTTRSSRSR